MTLLRWFLTLAVVSAALAVAGSASAAPLVWERSGGPEGGEVLVLAVDASVPGVVYAGGFGGVFKSVDGGSSWVWSGVGLARGTVPSLAVDPLRPGTVYAGTLEAGVFKSTDGGASWSQTAVLRDDVSTPAAVTALAVDSSSGTVFAGSDGLFVSEDGGASWRELSVGLFTGVSEIVIQAGRPGAIYVADPEELGVFRSDDGGESWIDVSPDFGRAALLGSPSMLVADPVRPGTVYVAGAGLFKTTDRGETWTSITRGLPCVRDAPCPDVGAVAIDPNDPQHLLLGLWDLLELGWGACIAARTAARAGDGTATGHAGPR